MRGGTLRQRVTIDERTVALDTFGQETVTWSELATVWAAVHPLSGREYLDSRQLQAQVSTRVRMRYRSDVTPHMRVRWMTHTYDVVDVVHDERRTQLDLMCSEVV
jgi:SPP1 family predicted phage head-tail adaptor